MPKDLLRRSPGWFLIFGPLEALGDFLFGNWWSQACLFVCVTMYPILPEIRNGDRRSSTALVDENILFSGLSRQSDRTVNTNQRMESKQLEI